jgi:hypothetical protein
MWCNDVLARNDALTGASENSNVPETILMGLVRMTIHNLKKGWYFGRFLWPLYQSSVMTRRRVELWCLFCGMVMFCISSFSWAADPTTIRLCQDSEDVYPWTLRQR